MRVRVEELQLASSILLKHLSDNGQDEFEINEDFYWDVVSDVRYDPYAKIEEASLTIGQLSDDWMEAQGIARGQRQIVGYALVWLSAVLRRVGEQSVG